MKKKITIISIVFSGAIVAIYFVLSSDFALITHPRGIIARRELDLITKNLAIMLAIIVPTFILLLTVSWKYRSDNPKTRCGSYQSYGFFKQAVLWLVPSIVVVIMSVITWDATHKLDPYKPLVSEVEPLTIQVVALDWKWLFIYPEEKIATVNFLQFPERTPIHFVLAADGSPMNSFWIPQLSGQIYCMSGMTTSLHIMADGSGSYTGRASEINGEGFADMTFTAKSTSRADFDRWVLHIKQGPLQLTDQVYDELIIPSKKHPITFYSYVKEKLFNEIVMKYMHPDTSSWRHSSLVN